MTLGGLGSRRNLDRHPWASVCSMERMECRIDARYAVNGWKPIIPIREHPPEAEVLAHFRLTGAAHRA